MKTDPFLDELGEYFDVLEQSISALRAEIRELKACRYVGLWSAAQAFARGNLATHRGQLWHSNKDGNSERPGSSDAWTLAVKGAPENGRPRGEESS